MARIKGGKSFRWLGGECRMMVAWPRLAVVETVDRKE